jgi:hypothetical protein
MIGFTAIQTRYDGSKPDDDPWALVTLEQQKKLWVSDWTENELDSGWLGSGFTKVGVKVCTIGLSWLSCHADTRI